MSYTLEELVLPDGSDLCAFVKLYRRFGIECKIIKDMDEYHKIVYVILLKDSCPYHREQVTESEKFEGYGCFYSAITFDANGKFVSQGFWE